MLTEIYTPRAKKQKLHYKIKHPILKRLDGLGFLSNQLICILLIANKSIETNGFYNTKDSKGNVKHTFFSMQELENDIVKRYTDMLKKKHNVNINAIIH